MKDGGPAFPTEAFQREGHRDYKPPKSGMSLRDWFAGQAMAALVANAFRRMEGLEKGQTLAEYIAKKAYGAADAMLAERERRDK